MKRFLFRSDIPWKQDDSTGILPWIVACTTFLAAMALAGGLVLTALVSGWQEKYLEGVTVQVPAGSESKIETVRAVLERTSGLGAVEQLPEAKVRALVEPWLGSAKALELLPMPTLLIAERKGAVDIDKLKAQLAKEAEDIELTDHEAWTRKFAGFASNLRLVAFFASAQALLITALIIMLVTRTGLKLHQRTITLLHLFGAEDSYIARQFEVQALRLTIQGAAIGALLAFLACSAILLYTMKLDMVVLRKSVLSAWEWPIVLLPLVMALIAMISARIATLRILRRV